MKRRPTALRIKHIQKDPQAVIRAAVSTAKPLRLADIFYDPAVTLPAARRGSRCAIGALTQNPAVIDPDRAERDPIVSVTTAFFTPRHAAGPEKNENEK